MKLTTVIASVLCGCFGFLTGAEVQRVEQPIVPVPQVNLLDGYRVVGANVYGNTRLKLRHCRDQDAQKVLKRGTRFFRQQTEKLSHVRSLDREHRRLFMEGLFYRDKCNVEEEMRVAGLIEKNRMQFNFLYLDFLINNHAFCSSLQN